MSHVILLTTCKSCALCRPVEHGQGYNVARLDTHMLGSVRDSELVGLEYSYAIWLQQCQFVSEVSNKAGLPCHCHYCWRFWGVCPSPLATFLTMHDLSMHISLRYSHSCSTTHFTAFSQLSYAHKQQTQGIVCKMAQDVGMVWKYCSVIPIPLGWFSDLHPYMCLLSFRKCLYDILCKVWGWRSICRSCEVKSQWYQQYL